MSWTARKEEMWGIQMEEMNGKRKHMTYLANKQLLNLIKQGNITKYM